MLAFGIAGTVTASWPNPLFVRMTPSGTAELVFLTLGAALVGVFTAVRRPACSLRRAGVGGVLGFLGIACPVCNKLLVLLIGAPVLMTYYEPIRLYVAAAGVLLLATAIAREVVLARRDRFGPTVPAQARPYGRTGSKYHELHQTLMSTSGSVAEESALKEATKLGLDMEQLRRCSTSASLALAMASAVPHGSLGSVRNSGWSVPSHRFASPLRRSVHPAS